MLRRPELLAKVVVDGEGAGGAAAAPGGVGGATVDKSGVFQTVDKSVNRIHCGRHGRRRGCRPRNFHKRRLRAA